MADEFSEMFEAAAQMREGAAHNTEQAEMNLQVAQRRHDALLARSELTTDERAIVAASVETLVASAQTLVASFVSQAKLAGKALALVNPAQPEHVGVVEAEADAIESLAKGLRALAGGMSLIKEIKRRLDGAATDNEGGE